MSILIPYIDQHIESNTFYYRIDGRTKTVCRNLSQNTKAVLSEFCSVLRLPKSASKERIIEALENALVFETQKEYEEANALLVSEHSSDCDSEDDYDSEDELEDERAYEEEWNEWLEETIKNNEFPEIDPSSEVDPDATEVPSEGDDWLSPIKAPAPVPEPEPVMNIVEETSKAPKIVLRIRKNGNNELIAADKPKLYVLKWHKLHAGLRMGEYLSEKDAVAAALRKMVSSGIFLLTKRQENKQHMGPEWVNLNKVLHNIKEDAAIATHMAQYISTFAQLREYLYFKKDQISAPFAESYDISGKPYTWYLSCNGVIV